MKPRSALPHSGVDAEATSIWIVACNDADRALLSALCVVAGQPATSALASVDEFRAAMSREPVETPGVVLIDLPCNPDAGAKPLAAVLGCPSTPDTLFILVDGSGDTRRIGDFLSHGGFDYLSKPLRLDELRLRLRASTRLALEIQRRKRREEELKQSLARIRADLAAASRLQASLLPKQETATRVSHSLRFRPCETLGGDLLNIVPIADSTCFYLFDVAGHGVPAALFAIGLQRLLSDGAGSLLRDAAGLCRDPGEVLNDLNERFPLNTDTFIYFTITLARFVHSDGLLHYAQAGHPGLLVKAKDEAVRQLEEGGLPVGMLPGRPYASSMLPLRRGARILMFSDGATEASHPTSAEPYGLAKLMCWLDHDSTLLDALIGQMMDDILGWRAPAQPEDDLSLLLVELPPC